MQITGTDFDETRFNFNKSYMRFSRLDNSVISYFGFSKKSISIDEIAKFKEAYNRVQERGDFKQILDKYLCE